MNRSAKRAHHEQSRKKHRHEMQEHARELARRRPKLIAAWVLGVGIALMVAVVVLSLVL